MICVLLLLVLLLRSSLVASCSIRDTNTYPILLNRKVVRLPCTRLFFFFLPPPRLLLVSLPLFSLSPPPFRPTSGYVPFSLAYPPPLFYSVGAFERGNCYSFFFYFFISPPPPTHSHSHVISTVGTLNILRTRTNTIFCPDPKPLPYQARVHQGTGKPSPSSNSLPR